LTNNGGYGNPTNGDFAVTNVGQPPQQIEEPTDCFAGNQDTSGTLTSSPSNAEQMWPICNGKDAPPRRRM
jgi:hypothetical protein